MKKVLVLLGCFILVSGALTAQQKYGHLNFGNLIAAMPATEKANSDLEVFQQQMVAKGEDMAKKFQDDYAKFITDVQGGTLAPVQQQERQAKLQEDQQKIVAYEQEIRQKVQEKRSELLEPIVAEAEKAIAEVAKEKGYAMIFDTSVFNAILFSQESDDVMPLVKAKLGLK